MSFLSLDAALLYFDLWHRGGSPPSPPGTTRHHGLIRFVADSGSAEFGGINAITLGGGLGYNLVLNNRIGFQVVSGVLPPQLSTTGTYYVASLPSTNTVMLSLTKGGATFVVGTAAGTYTYIERDPSGCDSLPIWAKHESTQAGYARQAFTYGAGDLDTIQNVIKPDPSVPQHAASGGTILYTHAFTIIDGNTVVGGTTGTVEYWENYGTTESIPDGQTYQFPVIPRLGVVGAQTVGTLIC